MLAKSFEPEILDDYNCIKCALWEYLTKFLSEEEKFNIFTSQKLNWIIDTNLSEIERLDFLAALEFFRGIYMTQDIDEEEFRERFKHFKLTTSNSSSHEFAR